MQEQIQKRIEAIITNLDQLPSIPDVASRVINMVNDPDVSFKAMADEISKDQAITTNILKLCNSAFFSKGKEVTSMDRAIVTLGIKEVKDIVIVAATREVLSKAIQGYDLQRGELWRHGLAVAILSKRIALAKNRKAVADVAFTGGIIHDVGKTVLALFVQSTFKDILATAESKKITFDSAEKEIMGYDHQEIGEKVLSKWRFPEVLKAMVRFHHDPAAAPKEFLELVSIVHVANVICLMGGIGIGADGLYHELSDVAIKALGLSNKELEQFYSDLPQVVNQTREML
ncbi:MAG: HDOD domain-containing protein [Spirochaetes bacterium]|nr:MAG: HDOD domain-containing protein [Spirochaetota bacterium]